MDLVKDQWTLKLKNSLKKGQQTLIKMENYGYATKTGRDASLSSLCEAVKTSKSHYLNKNNKLIR